MTIPVKHKNTFTMQAGATITAGAGVVSDTEGIVIMGAVDNDLHCVGFAIEGADTSDIACSIAGPGSIVQAVCGTSGITHMDWLTLHGASGRVTTLGTVSGTAYNVVGLALEAGDTVGDKIAVQVILFQQRAEQA